MQQYLKAVHNHTPSQGLYKDIVRTYQMVENWF